MPERSKQDPKLYGERATAVASATLEALLAVRRLPPEAGVVVLRDVLIGLAQAHEQGLVHGGIRAADVLVDLDGHCRLQAPARPVAAAADDPPDTEVDDAAPELRAGAPASPTTDGYSAAVVFLASLADQHEAPVGTGLVPSTYEELAGPVRRVVARATAQDPAERYPDVRSFREELEAAAVAVHGPQWAERGQRFLADSVEATVSSHPLVGPVDDGPGPWWRRRRLALAALALLVLLAVAVVVLFEGGEPKREVREPFDQALAALARAPGVRYQDHNQFTGYYDLAVTATAERFGAMGGSEDFSDKVAEDVTTVAGRDYVSYRNDAALKGWIYDPGGDEKNLAPRFKTYVVPGKLAAQLRAALDEQPRLPVVGDEADATVAVDGQPAWRADTVQGYLYVSKNAPYRVLRWEPPNLETAMAALKAMAKDPSSRRSRAMEAHTPLTYSLGINLTPVTDATALYGKVVRLTKELASATTGGSVQILQQRGDGSKVACSHTGCLVDVAFSGPVYNATSPAHRLDNVYIEMKVASITTGGQEVGGCSSGLRAYRLTGASLAGKISCNNPAGGPLFDRADAANRARANSSGRSSFWDYTSAPELLVHPLSPTDVDQLVAKEQHELQSLG
ncbi:hypothetical protein [Streptomyces sp. NPDC093225]|uniref:hypothetical protein n=1 Tax=Streptomyces sp. NPDC093225 TaxID=3366034 RepID=UPI0037F22CE0